MKTKVLILISIALIASICDVRASTQTVTYASGQTYTITYDIQNVVPYNGFTYYDQYYITNNSSVVTLDLVWTGSWTVKNTAPGSTPVTYNFSTPVKIAPGAIFNPYNYTAFMSVIQFQFIVSNTFAVVYAQQDSAQTFVTQPASQTISPGATLSFSLFTAGQSSTYVWYKNGGAITGTLTSPALSIPNATSGTAGTYYCVASNEFYTVTSSSAVVTVNTPVLQSVAPTSANSTATVGTAWLPTFTGGSGGTNYLCVASYTPWQGGSWTPTASGTYTFYVCTHCSPGYTGNDLDPTAGELEINYTAYSVVVSSVAVAPTISVNPVSIPVHVAWAPAFVGGSGGTDYFCVAGYTNWQGGTWTPAATGTYTYYVATHCASGVTGNDLDPTAGELEINYTAYTVTVH